MSFDFINTIDDQDDQLDGSVSYSDKYIKKYF